MTFFSRNVTAQFASGECFLGGFPSDFLHRANTDLMGIYHFEGKIQTNSHMKKMVLKGKFHLFYVHCREIITLIGC